MRLCDLCQGAIVARLVLLGGRPNRRVWLCAACHERHERHELSPADLLALARLTVRRRERCEWCAERAPEVQVRIPGTEGQSLAFQLCSDCALEARSQVGGRILHSQAALSGQATVDPRYERARDVARRRQAIRRIK